jgi:hypothetical protein
LVVASTEEIQAPLSFRSFAAKDFLGRVQVDDDAAMARVRANFGALKTSVERAKVRQALLGRTDARLVALSAVLYGAARKGLLRVLEMLLELGIDANLDDSSEVMTPLIAACACGVGVSVLLAHGAHINVNSARAYGSPLLAAIMVRNGVVVAELLAAGADANLARHSDGCTPLHAACHEAEAQVIQQLLDHGADILKSDCRGNLPRTEFERRFSAKNRNPIAVSARRVIARGEAMARARLAQKRSLAPS